MSVDEHPQIQIGQLELVIGVAEENRAAGLAEGMTQTAHDLRKERIREIGHDDPDRVPLPSLQPAGELVGSIPEFLDRLLNTPPRGFRHPVGAVRDR